MRDSFLLGGHLITKERSDQESRLVSGFRKFTNGHKYIKDHVQEAGKRPETS